MHWILLICLLLSSGSVLAEEVVLRFPQFADGSEAGLEAQTRIMLRNNGSGRLSGAIHFFSPDGSPADLTGLQEGGNPIPFELPPWGVQEFRTGGAGALKSGFVEVSLAEGVATFLKGTEVFEISGLPVSVENAEPALLHRLYVRHNWEEATGVAVYNPSARETAELDLILLDGEGGIFGSSRMELPPRHHSALFVGEGPLFGPTFNELPDSFEGTLGISVRQGPAVGVLGLIQKRGSSALSALPVLKQSSPVYGNAVEALQVEVLAEYPHDVQAFTQGLLWHDGHLFESTGLTGRSSLRMVVLETGEVVRRVDLPGSLFGEGLALVEDRLIQLTWLAGKALYYDLETFEEIGTSSYLGQGWGLTYGDTFLIMSDGSNQLTFRDPASFAIWQRVPVTLNGSPVRRLNELEWVDGQVYANIWQESEIVRINPQSGEVTAVIDTSALPYQPQNPADDSLNGIAYLPERETFLLTGKKWPKIFEVRFIPTAD